MIGSLHLPLLKLDAPKIVSTVLASYLVKEPTLIATERKKLYIRYYEHRDIEIWKPSSSVDNSVYEFGQASCRCSMCEHVTISVLKPTKMVSELLVRIENKLNDTVSSSNCIRCDLIANIVVWLFVDKNFVVIHYPIPTEHIVTPFVLEIYHAIAASAVDAD
jgi:hypothetical protein